MPIHQNTVKGLFDAQKIQLDWTHDLKELKNPVLDTLGPEGFDLLHWIEHIIAWTLYACRPNSISHKGPNKNRLLLLQSNQHCIGKWSHF